MYDKIHVWRRTQAIKLLPQVEAVLISIWTPSPLDTVLTHALKDEDFFGPPKLEGSWKGILSLGFHDVDAHSEGVEIFNCSMARKILDFVEQHQDSEWHVHCDAGMSRSVGVAVALSEIYGKQVVSNACGTILFANKKVISVIREESQVNNRYVVTILHGESGTVYHVVDTAPPEAEQPCVIHSWKYPEEPNACYLATDFCERHNAKEK